MQLLVVCQINKLSKTTFESIFRNVVCSPVDIDSGFSPRTRQYLPTKFHISKTVIRRHYLGQRYYNKRPVCFCIIYDSIHILKYEFIPIFLPRSNCKTTFILVINKRVQNRGGFIVCARCDRGATRDVLLLSLLSERYRYLCHLYRPGHAPL